MTPSPLTLKLKEAFQLHGNVNLRRYLITLLSSNLTWRILCLPVSWIETTTLFCAWRQYLFGNWSRFQICDPDLLTQYIYKTEVNCLQNGGYQLQYCLYLPPYPPHPTPRSVHWTMGSIFPPLESGLAWWLTFINRMRRKWHCARPNLALLFICASSESLCKGAVTPERPLRDEEVPDLPLSPPELQAF